MLVSPFLLEDCIQASLLHHQGFYKGWPTKEFESLLQSSMVHGLKVMEEKNLKGFILWQSVKDEADILTLIVDEKYQKNGVASALLREMVDTLQDQGISTLFLEVAEDNEAAKRFYIKHGFYFISTRPNYYSQEKGKRISALTFRKNIL